VRNPTRNSKADEGWVVLQALRWSRKDALAFGLGASAAIAILVNGLLLQTGSHPAPMFKGAAPAAIKDTTAAALPRARPLEAAPKVEPIAKIEPPGRPSVEIVSDIQRELARRGFYDGVADGRYGPRTDAAVRDFEQAAAVKPSAEPNEALLATIRRSQPKSKATPATGGRPVAQPVRLDPIAELLAPSKRVIAVQRALAEYGYGQLKPTGVVDAETKAAVEKFERERKLPITGQVSERVARELAAITGRPLE